MDTAQGIVVLKPWSLSKGEKNETIKADVGKKRVLLYL